MHNYKFVVVCVILCVLIASQVDANKKIKAHGRKNLQADAAQKNKKSGNDG